MRMLWNKVFIFLFYNYLFLFSVIAYKSKSRPESSFSGLTMYNLALATKVSAQRLLTKVNEDTVDRVLLCI